ncbi:MAG: CmpA/NrtA family ABC transporter substrate-binding protein [Hyphomicrobium sp.]|jgi:NitT/TauT family transport system ATP-binding protein/nitrate/nitrite transport system substrate-binding protein
MPLLDPEGSATKSLPEVHAGFIPLLDCAPFVIARELGFDVAHGLSLKLHREVSWANIRDKLDLGVFDCAHMLAPMPIAATLGLGRATEPIIVPMALSLNGNAITVSLGLHEEMRLADAAATAAGGTRAAHALAAVVRARQREGREPLTLGMVYPFSAHNYDLRYWLAGGGVDPDNDVNLIVVPPPLIVQSLASGRVDGFCVGEPWNSLAVHEGLGAIIATKSELWARSPEKVVGVREGWAKRNPVLLERLIRALVTAATWLVDPDNRRKAAGILARPEYVGVASEILMRPLSGDMRLGLERDAHLDEMVLFQRGDATFPWRSHAIWFLTQMIRWGHVREPFNIAEIAERVYRPDLYRKAVASLGIVTPEADFKREGSQAFFGSEEFDPAAPLAYLARLEIRAPAAELDKFAMLND